MDENKSKALAAALSQIEKQFGKGSVMRMGEADIARDIQTVSTGSLGLDIGLGIGGLPRGRVVEIYGPESSGKTTLTLSVIAQMQKLGGSAAFIDAEPQMGLQARLMSQALRKLTANIKRSNTLVIFINQIRMKIGVMFGNPETTTGGNALKFYASVRIDIRRIGSIKRGEEVIGSETRAKIVKNKVAPPFRQAEFDILYGEGISREGEIIELGVTHNIIEKSGAWYSYGKDRIGQGKDNTREYLKENPKMANEIEAKIRAAVGVAGGPAGTPEVKKPPLEVVESDTSKKKAVGQ